MITVSLFERLTRFERILRKLWLTAFEKGENPERVRQGILRRAIEANRSDRYWIGWIRNRVFRSGFT